MNDQLQVPGVEQHDSAFIRQKVGSPSAPMFGMIVQAYPSRPHCESLLHTGAQAVKAPSIPTQATPPLGSQEMSPMTSR